MITWLPLSKAYEHVLAHERSGDLAARQLVRAFADKVRTRGYVVYHKGPRREGMQDPLSRELWTEYEGQPPAEINPTDESARLSGCGHPHDPCVVYRVEVAWEDLLAIWPEHPAAAKPLSGGRPPVHDSNAILVEAAVFIHENGVPATLGEFVTKIQGLLDDKTPGVGPKETYLKNLLGPLYKRLQAQQ